jgi:hypothetical protein
VSADGTFGPDGHPPPAYPYAPHVPPGTNGKSVASLVSSAAGLVCCGLSSVAGIILGILAMRETRRTGQDGHGMALAGTIIGGIVTGLWLLYWVVIVGLMASGWSLV